MDQPKSEQQIPSSQKCEGCLKGIPIIYAVPQGTPWHHNYDQVVMECTNTATGTDAQ